MTKKTIQHNGATITVETETGGMRLDLLLAQQALGIRDMPDRQMYRAIQFAQVWSQSTVEGDLGFDWSDSPVDNEAMQETMVGWLALSPDLVGEWMQAVNEVNYTPNDPDLKPPEDVEKKGSKTPKSSPKES